MLCKNLGVSYTAMDSGAPKFWITGKREGVFGGVAFQILGYIRDAE